MRNVAVAQGGADLASNVRMLMPRGNVREWSVFRIVEEIDIDIFSMQPSIDELYMIENCMLALRRLSRM